MFLCAGEHVSPYVHMLVYVCLFVCKWEFVLCGMCALSMGPWRAPCRPAGGSICWGGPPLSGGRSAGPTTMPRPFAPASPLTGTCSLAGPARDWQLCTTQSTRHCGGRGGGGGGGQLGRYERGGGDVQGCGGGSNLREGGREWETAHSKAAKTAKSRHTANCRERQIKTGRKAEGKLK